MINKEIFEGKWEQVKGEIQSRWGELTDDDIDQINGETSKLVGKLKERYGKEKAEAEKEIDHWVSELKSKL